MHSEIFTESAHFQLDNQAFEELAADIFDEVDRREVEQGE